MVLTLKMTSAQVVETSVNVISNSLSQDYTHPDDRTLLNDMTPGFKPFTNYGRLAHWPPSYVTGIYDESVRTLLVNIRSTNAVHQDWSATTKRNSLGVQVTTDVRNLAGKCITKLSQIGLNSSTYISKQPFFKLKSMGVIRAA